MKIHGASVEWARLACELEWIRSGHPNATTPINEASANSAEALGRSRMAAG